MSLDPQVETPASRQFAGDPLAQVRANRARFVSSVLTIIRAWIVSGAAPVPCKALASYGQWSDWVRQPLLWLGLPDPADRLFDRLAQDPDRELLGRVIHLWKSQFGSSPTMARDAIKRSDALGNADFREILLEIAEQRGEVNGRRLGRWLARHQGQIVDGLRFDRASGTTSAERWQVRAVQRLSVMTDKSVESGGIGKCVSGDEICEVEL